MKKTVLICLGLFLLGAATFLLQLWFTPWSAETFSKLMVTDGVLLAVAILIAFLIKEHQDDGKVTKKHELD